MCKQFKVMHAVCKVYNVEVHVDVQVNTCRVFALLSAVFFCKLLM